MKCQIEPGTVCQPSHFTIKSFLGIVSFQLALYKKKTKLDVHKGLHTLPVSPFEAQVGKLWPSSVAQQSYIKVKFTFMTSRLFLWYSSRKYGMILEIYP